MMPGTTTRKSRHMARAPKQLMLEEVMDLFTGAACSVTAIRGADYADAIRARNEIQDAIAAGKPRYACPVCGEVLKLRSAGRPEGDPMAVSQFHFWHWRRNSCPLSQKNGWDRKAILAAKYHGQREGQAHIRLKSMIRDSLECDPRFSNVRVEETWRLQGDPTQWRRPDVSAVFCGKPIVFEIQLSTTFVDVMAERRNFYRERGALLIWIVSEYDHDWARITHHDIFYTNNRNIFVANQDTLDASVLASSLRLEANWQEPVIQGGGICYRVKKKMVEFSDLTLDFDGQRAYFFDCDREYARQKAMLETQPLREIFERQWFYSGGIDNSLSAIRKRYLEWSELRVVFRTAGVDVPEHRSDLQPLLNSIYSVRDFREGRLVGWRYDNLVKLAHHLYDQHKEVLWPFCLAISVYGMKNAMRAQDPKGRWKEKKDLLVGEFLSGKCGARIPKNTKIMLKILFPEMTEIMDRAPAEILGRPLTAP